jgi:uncharacterized SAM-binding protein YcdF (DUF218 family)
MPSTIIPEEHRADVELLWDYLQMHHEVQPADVGIGLGGHDHTVPEVATDLFKRGFFPYLVFTGANAPTTIDLFPRGEAVHFGEYAVSHGVPEGCVLLEPHARSTAENITFTRRLLAERGLNPRSALIISRPYQQRRAYGMFARLWPATEVRCAATPTDLDSYIVTIGDVDRVIGTMVGDLERIPLDFASGHSVRQDPPESVLEAGRRLRSQFRLRAVSNEAGAP